MQFMENQFSQMAALIGDPIRAKVLWKLFHGRAYTATELAMKVNADLLAVEIQGRHRYYKYARPDIAYAIEALISLVPKENIEEKAEETYKPIAYCRTCYDHLAGKVGVMLAEGLLHHEFIHKQDNDFDISPKGIRWFASFGIDADELKMQKRVFAKACLDWSERRHHLAGALGSSLLNVMLTNDWICRTKDSRAIIITDKGKLAMNEHFGVVV
jgi:hypothetical protein